MKQETTDMLTQNRWIWLTTSGWVIGIFLVTGFAMLGEIILNTKDESGGQVAVGLGMGTGVGLMQWVVLRKYLEPVLKWVWFSMIGFTLSYVLFDVIAVYADFSIKPEVALLFATLSGGFISSWLQYRFVLRRITANASRWIIYSTIAWLLAHLITGFIFLINSNTFLNLPKVMMAIIALLGITIGGPVLGFITARFIVPVCNQQKLNGH